MKYIVDSLKGVKRKKNQDGYLILSNENISIFIVFDGLSSNEFSYIYINIFKEKIKKEFEDNENFHQSISDILFKIHLSLINSGAKGYSTISMIVYRKKMDIVEFLSIGDSRIYIFTSSYLESITKDDNLSERKNILTRYLGSPQLKREDFQLKKINSKCHFLICTDGFYSLMETELKEYFRIINLKYLKNILNGLKRLQTTFNSDDSTYILIKNEI